MKKHQLVNLLNVLGDSDVIKANFHTESHYSCDYSCAIEGIGMTFAENGIEATIKMASIDSNETAPMIHASKQTLMKALGQISDDCEITASLDRTYSSIIGELNRLEIKFNKNELCAVLCATEVKEVEEIAA